MNSRDGRIDDLIDASTVTEDIYRPAEPLDSTSPTVTMPTSQLVEGAIEEPSKTAKELFDDHQVREDAGLWPEGFEDYYADTTAGGDADDSEESMEDLQKHILKVQTQMLRELDARNSAIGTAAVKWESVTEYNGGAAQSPLKRTKFGDAAEKPRIQRRGGKPDTKKTPKFAQVSAGIEDLQSGDFIATAQSAQDSKSMPEFEGTSVRKEAFDQIKQAMGPENHKAFHADKKALDQACKLFGQRQIKPMDGNEWYAHGMKSTLRPHQVLGTGFMLWRELHAPLTERGGILADVMGFGKTVTTLALIANKQKRKVDTGPTLIIAPASLLHQWRSEIDKHCERVRDYCKQNSGLGDCVIFKDKTFRLHDAPLQQMYHCHILLVSYEEVARNYPFPDQPPPELTSPESIADFWEDHNKRKRLLHRVNFHRVILDEAHAVRNPESKAFRAIKALTAKHVWCLTGTPLVNGPYDIWTLLSLIGAEPKDDYDKFKLTYSKSTSEETANDFRDAVTGRIFRRTHASRIFNARIVTLPRTGEHTLTVHFNHVERAIYDIVAHRFRARLMMMSEFEGDQRASAYAMFVQLRQLTAHPIIMQAALLDMLEKDDLEQLREVAIKSKNDMNEHGRLLIRRIRTMLASQVSTDGRQQYKDMYAPGNKRLVAGDKLIGDHGPDTGKQYGLRARYHSLVEGLLAESKVKEAAIAKECVYCGQSPHAPRITSCLHLYCEVCLDEDITEGAEKGLHGGYCRSCGEFFSFTEDLGEEVIQREASLKRKAKRKADAFEVDLKTLFGTDAMFLPSAKLLAVKAQVLQFMEETPPCKIVIFTQWLMLVRVLEGMCKMERWGCLSYHGKMNLEARNAIVKEFTEDPDIRILICSLKAGGVGLNLTMASRVICIDPWFNNAIEDQAFGRVYRIGQTRETSMLKLYVSDTVDQHLEEIKERKQTTIDAVDHDRGMGRALTKKDYLSLFTTKKSGAGNSSEQRNTEPTKSAATEAEHDATENIKTTTESDGAIDSDDDWVKV